MKSKILTGLLSIVVSFGLWLYVVTVVSPNFDQKYTDIPVVTQGEALLQDRGLMVTSNETPMVSLHLEGNRADLNKLNSSNITVDNLAVKYGGAHGIGGSHQSELLVQNCEVAYIGGGIQQYKASELTEDTYIPCRYGNGVEVNASCDGYTVQNCWIHDIFDAGVTHQTGDNHTQELIFKDVTYKDNLIENCTYSVEYFAYRGATTKADMLLDNIRIDGNIMRNAGDGFSVTRTLQPSMWNMATHIMGWYNSPNVLVEGSSFVITNNVFDRAIPSAPDRTNRINSSLVLIAAENVEDLPDLEGNTYIHYVDVRYAYYGINNSLLTASNLSKYNVNNNVHRLLDDATGEMYFMEK
jgi:hypothetical protein